ncbi:LCP family protein [uncultured Traorella sp.]|uniref:LCP family protein n=1 Tax=uncultured Traorella sp. TaxID=1929048 RepID=UPI0025F6FEC6|nr:LCP family protein [uncultured Traorella sp.]
MLKNSGFYFSMAFTLIAIGLIVQAIVFNIVPIKYLIPAIILLILIVAGMWYIQLGRKMSKMTKIIGKVIIVILSVILAAGNWMLYTTNSAFNKITTDEDVLVYSIVVMKESGYEEVTDLSNKNFGIVSLGDVSTQAKALEDLETDLNLEPATVSYDSYIDFGDALYDGQVDAIVLDEGSRGLLEENHPDFNDATKVIKQYIFKNEAKDISKNVDVVTKPFNIYLTGIDTYGTISTRSRSDVNMIISVNPKNHQILLTGIPRDFYVPQTCQYNQLDKLTHTGIFGVDCTIETMENYLDIDLNYYVRVNFSSVVNIVDALGGITVNSPYAFTTLHGKYEIKQGENQLNGEETLGFVRERYSFADGDRERSRNQMRVMEAMIDKALSPQIITNYANILSAVSDSFQTNMSTEEMTSLIKQQLNDMSSWDIKQIQVSGQGATMWTPANGFDAYVMIPDEACVENAKKLIDKIISGELITDEDVKIQNELVANAG